MLTRDLVPLPGLSTTEIRPRATRTTPPGAQGTQLLGAAHCEVLQVVDLGKRGAG